MKVSRPLKFETSNLRIRNALESLAGLIDGVDQESSRSHWIEKLNTTLEQLENALGEEATLDSGFFKDASHSHPRLLSTCTVFFENGRQLLRQATAVVLLSVQSQRATELSIEPLREATATLIQAVKRHQQMAAELMVEASQDIGGQG